MYHFQFSKSYINGSYIKLLKTAVLLQIIGNIALSESQLFNVPKSILIAPSQAKTITPTKADILFYGRYMAAFYCLALVKPALIKTCLKWKSSVKTYKIVANYGANTQAKVSLLSDKKEIVIAFRGTVGLQDSILDITAFAAPSFHGKNEYKMHRGFYLATKSVYEKVVNEVNDILEQYPEVKKLSLTGLSLGGAMASIALFLFKTEAPFSQNFTYTLLTFAQPRAGNVAFARYLNNLAIKMGRVVVKADMVPHLPPVSVAGTKVFLDNYVHHAQEIWITGKEMEELKVCSNDVLEDPECSNSHKDYEYTWAHHPIVVPYVLGGKADDIDGTVLALLKLESLQ